MLASAFAFTQTGEELVQKPRPNVIFYFLRSYYIPGDAVVYGTLNNGGQHNNDGYNIR